MNVLVVSSKYLPEYSGSGLRAHKTYKRLARKFAVRFDVLCDSVAVGGSGHYRYEDVIVHRVAVMVGQTVAGASRTGPVRRLLHAGRHRLNYLIEAAMVFRFLVTKRGRYDAFHVFGNTNVTSAALTFAKIFRIPTVVEFTSDRSSPHAYEPVPVQWIWGSRFPPFFRIVCISPKLQEMCRAFGYEDNVWCRPNPVDESRFFPDLDKRAEYRRKHTKFGVDDVVLCYIAKFMPSKQQHFLIKVVQRLPDRYRLVLVGPLVDSGPLAIRDRSYFASIQSDVGKLGLSQRVIIVPSFVEWPEEYMKLSDVFVFPSTDEGLGTPVLEAIACGIPVVAHRMDGITDAWIENGKSGYLSELDVDEFATKVEEAVRIPREMLLTEARRILATASTSVIDQHYYELLREVRHAAQRSENDAETPRVH